MANKEVIHDPVITGIDEVSRSWGWFLTLGILFIVLGCICVIADVTATFATVVFFGWLLLFSGIFALIQGFRTHTWSGFLLSLLTALLRGFTGYVLVRYPLTGAGAITLVLACFFVVGGLFRSIGAAMLQLPRWGWSVFSGLVSLALGIILLVSMPVSSIWFIGFAIGIDLIVEGVSLIGFASAVHTAFRLPGLKTA